jgi:hypothetical protein
MAMKSKILLLIFLSWFLSPGISAKETLKGASTDSDAQEYMLDEVIVTGDSSLHSLEMEMIRAEELKYEIFNSLNSTDEFDITCKWYTSLGSRIKKWGCDVGYMKDARTEDARYMLYHEILRDKSGWLIPDIQRTVELAHKTEALNKEMIELAVKHPELATAMIRANELKKLYEAERRKRFKNNKLSILAGNLESDENDVILNEIDIYEKAFIDHNRGAMPDEIWERWDSWCKTKFQRESYRKLWASANHDKYADEFIGYVNIIISGK